MSPFRLLKRNEIDENKWNALIHQSVYSLPYAFTWYLDAVAENWSAAVYQDYKVVMPLVWLRKLAVKCLYQPYYCQQLGFFSKTHLEDEIAQELIAFAAQKFPYVDINLNPSAASIAEKLNLGEKKNLLLSLNRDYKFLQSLYSENHQRNIARAIKAGLTFTEGIELKSLQKFYVENINHQKENFKPKHALIFKALTGILMEKKTAKIFAATSTDGELKAAVLIIFHRQRLISIINTSSTTGKKQGASHFLFGQLIQKFSNQPYLLDFEGSSISGIARFYEGFGAEPEIFYNYHYSAIKNAVKWFK